MGDESSSSRDSLTRILTDLRKEQTRSTHHKGGITSVVSALKMIKQLRDIINVCCEIQNLKTTLLQTHTNYIVGKRMVCIVKVADNPTSQQQTTGILSKICLKFGRNCCDGKSGRRVEVGVEWPQSLT